MPRNLDLLARKFDDFSLVDLRVLKASLEGPAVEQAVAADLYDAVVIALEAREKKNPLKRKKK